MLLSTFLFLTLLFSVFLVIPFFVGEENGRALYIIAALGFVIIGLTMLADGRGLVVQDGTTTTIQNKTGNEVIETETINYEEISAGMTQFLQLSTLLGGLAIFYTKRTLFLSDKNRSFDRNTR
jgi:hypothetical protein